MSAPDQTAPALFVVDDQEPDEDAPERPRRPGRRSVGRHERALGTALRASGLDKNANYAAAVSLARAIASQMDAAEEYPVKGLYAMPQLAAQYRDTLKAIGLLPHGEGGDDGLLDDLGSASLGDTPDT